MLYTIFFIPRPIFAFLCARNPCLVLKFYTNCFFSVRKHFLTLCISSWAFWTTGVIVWSETKYLPVFFKRRHLHCKNGCVVLTCIRVSFICLTEQHTTHMCHSISMLFLHMCHFITWLFLHTCLVQLKSFFFLSSNAKAYKNAVQSLF